MVILGIYCSLAKHTEIRPWVRSVHREMGILSRPFSTSSRINELSIQVESKEIDSNKRMFIYSVRVQKRHRRNVYIYIIHNEIEWHKASSEVNATKSSENTRIVVAWNYPKTRRGWRTHIVHISHLDFTNDAFFFSFYIHLFSSLFYLCCCRRI